VSRSIDDLRSDYGKRKMIGYEHIDNCDCHIVYTESIETLCVISLGKAAGREVQLYASKIWVSRRYKFHSYREKADIKASIGGAPDTRELRNEESASVVFRNPQPVGH